MSRSIPVNFHILSKDYVIACPEEKRDTLLASAKILKDKAQQVRESGKVGTNERIIAISALNIIHEYMNQDNQHQFDDEIMRLEGKLTLALSKLSE